MITRKNLSRYAFFVVSFVLISVLFSFMSQAFVVDITRADTKVSDFVPIYVMPVLPTDMESHPIKGDSTFFIGNRCERNIRTDVDYNIIYASEAGFEKVLGDAVFGEALKCCVLNFSNTVMIC